jgi:hypothetical protein
MNLSEVEGSLLRFLYDNFELPHEITIVEDTTTQDYTHLKRWIAIDTLSNRIGDQPKQNYFLHIAVQKQGALAKSELHKLVDLVVNTTMTAGTQIPVYAELDGSEIGVAQLVSPGLSPILAHFSGGMYRSFSFGLVYPGA